MVKFEDYRVSLSAVYAGVGAFVGENVGAIADTSLLSLGANASFLSWVTSLARFVVTRLAEILKTVRFSDVA